MFDYYNPSGIADTGNPYFTKIHFIQNLIFLAIARRMIAISFQFD